METNVGEMVSSKHPSNLDIGLPNGRDLPTVASTALRAPGRTS